MKKTIAITLASLSIAQMSFAQSTRSTLSLKELMSGHSENSEKRPISDTQKLSMTAYLNSLKLLRSELNAVRYIRDNNILAGGGIAIVSLGATVGAIFSTYYFGRKSLNILDKNMRGVISGIQPKEGSFFWRHQSLGAMLMPVRVPIVITSRSFLTFVKASPYIGALLTSAGILSVSAGNVVVVMSKDAYQYLIQTIDDEIVELESEINAK